ncbi:hypothetical protein BJ742DRAFT_819453 [Cladochytrium replicatum]|nr:hypothetical protein BJ742DRAFT_819453 [Cladochytrium replicatum]
MVSSVFFSVAQSYLPVSAVPVCHRRKVARPSNWQQNKTFLSADRKRLFKCDLFQTAFLYPILPFSVSLPCFGWPKTAQFPVPHPTVPPCVRLGVEPAHCPILGLINPARPLVVHRSIPAQALAMNPGYRLHQQSASMPVHQPQLQNPSTNNGIPHRFPSAMNPAIRAGFPYENTQLHTSAAFPTGSYNHSSPIRPPCGDIAWPAPVSSAQLDMDIPRRPDNLSCPSGISMPGLRVNNFMSSTVSDDANMGSSSGISNLFVPSVMASASHRLHSTSPVNSVATYSADNGTVSSHRDGDEIAHDTDDSHVARQTNPSTSRTLIEHDRHYYDTPQVGNFPHQADHDGPDPPLIDGDEDPLYPSPGAPLFAALSFFSHGEMPLRQRPHDLHDASGAAELNEFAGMDLTWMDQSYVSFVTHDRTSGAVEFPADVTVHQVSIWTQTLHANGEESIDMGCDGGFD